MNFITPCHRLLQIHYRHRAGNLKLQLSRFLNRQNISDRVEITRTVYGVIRKDILLDHLIGLFCQSKNSTLPLPTRLWLKIGFFLVLYSDSYPDYAAVNEVVKAAPSSAKGLVNAVLRNLCRDKEEVRKKISDLTEPALKYSLSPLLVRELQKISPRLEPDLSYLDQEPVFHLRLNTHTSTDQDLIQLLEKGAIAFRPITQMQSFEISEAAQLVAAMAQQHRFHFQNTGSQLVSLAAAQYARQIVLDAQSAPGSKVLTLRLLRSDLTLFASDHHVGRLRLVKENCRRMQLPDIHLFAADITRPAFKDDYFDFFLIDAPCTASGTLRKNPDLKSKIDGEMVQRNVETQTAILQTLITARSKALILYSVCSFIEDETEGLIERVASRQHFDVLDLSPLAKAYGFSFCARKHGIYLLPSEHLNNDLFYLSLIRT